MIGDLNDMATSMSQKYIQRCMMVHIQGKGREHYWSISSVKWVSYHGDVCRSYHRIIKVFPWHLVLPISMILHTCYWTISLWMEVGMLKSLHNASRNPFQVFFYMHHIRSSVMIGQVSLFLPHAGYVMLSSMWFCLIWSVVSYHGDILDDTDQ